MRIRNPHLATLLFFSITCYFASAQIERFWFKTNEEIDKFYGDASPQRGSEAQHRSLANIMESIADMEHNVPQSEIPRMAGILRKLAKGNIYQIKERVNVYDLVQQLLLSTPGHARILVDQMEESLSDPENPGHDHQRSWILRETLPHLPSPETIWVLGNYLADERHTRDPSLSGSGDIGPNSMLATTGLRRIGLRESEEFIRTEGYTMSLPQDLENCRRWWELVKSGERTFSFKGHNVEYRFNPDGTWDTTPIANPPDDGPQPMEAEPVATDTREVPSQPVAPAEHEEPTPWRWIWIPIAVVLIAGFFGLRMFRKGES